jgi:chorismate mutase
MVTTATSASETKRLLRIRAVRGATTVEADVPELITDAVRELLETLVATNGIDPDDIVSAIFTATPDLTSEFPAKAARRLGWVDVPLLCAPEIAVPGALPRCVRVLLHVIVTDGRSMRAAYLRDARSLRPDLAPQ